jgi:LAO/AO transport system kinase
MADDLADRVLRGETRAVARLMRNIDDRVPGHRDFLRRLFSATGRAHIIGITGNPGVGKSTLVDRLIEALRAQGKRVGVVAIDPSSPLSGGAILGDRIRMQRHALDDGVFIRSLATRGHMGGLSRSTSDVVRVLDAAGFEAILIETVGVGQDEVDVTRVAHTTVVVVAPGLGDEIQAIKAGLLEIADVFVVNKADRDGAMTAVRDLEAMILLRGEPLRAGLHALTHRPGLLDEEATSVAGGWIPSVLQTVAAKNQGVDEVLAAVQQHLEHLHASDDGAQRLRRRAEHELYTAVRERLGERAAAVLEAQRAALTDRILSRELDPYDAAEEVLAGG